VVSACSRKGCKWAILGRRINLASADQCLGDGMVAGEKVKRGDGTIFRGETPFKRRK
jgi:hypothetical protein